MSEIPTVDLDFIISLLEESDKVQQTITVGNTSAYVLNNGKPLAQRTVYINRVENNQVDFECASGIAIKIKCLPQLLA